MPGAKAVVVMDGNGNKIKDAEAILATHPNQPFPLTNGDGYALAPFNTGVEDTYIKVTANGFKCYLQRVILADHNQDIVIGGVAGPGNIQLPPLSFNKPSRDRILNVKANLCNVMDATGLPIFEPMLSTLFYEDMNRANDWVVRLKDAGSTHITIEITGDYDEYLPWLGNRYPIVGMDFTNDIDSFRKFLDWIIGTDLIPIVKSGCDGQGYSPGGKTYGWQWGMDNLPTILHQLSDYHTNCLWSTGYDGCFPDWNPDQLLQFIKMMRDILGSQSCIDTEFGSGPGESISYCHMGNGSADWVDNKLGDLDSFSLELQTFAQSDEEIKGQIEGMTEVFVRIGPNGSYLHNDKTQVQMYESLAYWEIRKYADFNEAVNVANRAYDVGYRTFGNGLPNR
jgi:hypothetical protein